MKLGQQANDLYARGDTQSLEAAVALYRKALALVPPDRLPIPWALTQNDLGNSLSALGEIDPDSAYLKAAQVAYERALTVLTLETRPLDWALTSTNLGTVLILLGKRESGPDTLRRAINVLQVVADFSGFLDSEQGGSPLNVPAIHQNLGLALTGLGERDSRDSGLRLLARAVTAFEKARDRAEPKSMQWAVIQSNLGLALLRLGERMNDRDVLARAVAAHRAARDVHRREDYPVDWAQSQANLALSLAALGERENGTKSLEDAVEAYRLVLKIETPETMPHRWAIAQNDFGTILVSLGRRQQSGARLEEAIAAFRSALTKLDPRSPQWARTHQSLKEAQELRSRFN
ncbi:hypothetical protein CCR97_02620 [Rhodoplanes elegans]|uniref:MalT-like TPR region domain-containing protein n=1 Tax=Rhodoplanes elegans TaxID=29408 RepID=A0A327KE05_9BRAD|nr:hypothetical protein [Rhodoplanes elegans]RAI36266.1 hypothetical protein CH338_17845 [Rhodoplanes elegans]